MLNEGLLTQMLQYGLQTSNSSFLATSREKQNHDEPSAMGQILWNWRVFTALNFYLWAY